MRNCQEEETTWGPFILSVSFRSNTIFSSSLGLALSPNPLDCGYKVHLQFKQLCYHLCSLVRFLSALADFVNFMCGKICSLQYTVLRVLSYGSNIFPYRHFHHLKHYTHLRSGVNKDPSPQTLTNPGLFTITLVLLFPDFHINGITDYKTFWILLLSLSGMHLTCIQFVELVTGCRFMTEKQY